MESALFGCLTGSTTVGAYYKGNPAVDTVRLFPTLIIPIADSQWSIASALTPRDLGANPNVLRAFLMLQPMLAGSKSTPSFGVAADALPAPWRDNPVEVTIDFLDGKLDEGLPSTTIEFATFSRPEYPLDGLMICWGIGPLSDSGGVQRRFASQTVPEGPLRITLSVPGYQEDSVEFELADLRSYSWRPLLVPIDGPEGGPAPADLPTSLGIAQFAVVNHFLTGCEPSFGLTGDRNRDGLIDAGDLAPVED